MIPHEPRQQRVLVTSPEGGGLCARLEGLGWETYAIPTVTIHELDLDGRARTILRNIDQYAWIIITSARAGRILCQHLEQFNLSRPSRPRWVAVGSMTAAALATEGIMVAFIPTEFSAQAIGDELGPVAGERILLPRADAASSSLLQSLRARGAEVEELTLYRTIEAPEVSRLPLRQVLSTGIDVVVFTSGSGVRGFARLVDAPAVALRGVVVACIGPATASALIRVGLRPDVVADPHTTDGLVSALLRRADHGTRPYVS